MEKEQLDLKFEEYKLLSDAQIEWKIKEYKRDIEENEIKIRHIKKTFEMKIKHENRRFKLRKVLSKGCLISAFIVFSIICVADLIWIIKSPVNFTLNITQLLGAGLIGFIIIKTADIFVNYFMIGPKSYKFIDLIIKMIDSFSNSKMLSSQVTIPLRYKCVKLTELFYSAKTQKEIFLPTMAEWDFEIYEALKENKDANLFMINVRNTYGFVMAMWQKSPLGDLIEYVRKIAS
jgi:hypothetical protein